MGDWCNCIECVGEPREPDEAEAEAIRRYENGEKPCYSTGIDNSLTCGYGALNAEGFWEFPLPMRFVEAPNARNQATEPA